MRADLGGGLDGGAVRVRYRGDGKTYKVLLSDGQGGGPWSKSPSWQHDLPTTAGEEAEAVLPFGAFKPSLAPFEIFFELDEACALVWPNLILDAYFYFDLVVNFHTGYFDHDARRFVTGRWDVARGYLRGWFAVDFLASVPWDMLYAHVEGLYFNHCGLPMQDDDQRTLPFDLSPLDCLRLLRVLRVFRLGRIVSRLDLLGVHYNTGLY